jgi:NADP-dependent 3-hydroxy acid dehydrogenase YdfG
MASISASDAPVVVITGANNGIGFHMASTLLADGYRVAALDLSGENLSPLQAKYPGRALAYKCDVTSDAEVKAAVDGIVDSWQRVDVLVNNACIALFSPFDEKSIGDIRREFRSTTSGTSA